MFPINLEEVNTWGPYIVGYRDGSSMQIGEVAELYVDSVGSTDVKVVAWRGGPGKYPENFWPSSSTVGFVVHGSISVHVLDEGRIDHLGAGTFFRYDKNQRLQWKYNEPTLKVEFLSQENDDS